MKKLVGLTGMMGLLGLIVAGCCCPVVGEPPCPPTPMLPATTTVAFERVVWGLPVGVEICYPPGVPNEAQVLIFAKLPTRFYSEWKNQVTTATVVTWAKRYYRAIPVAAPLRPAGVQWYLVLLEDHLVEIERLDEPLRYIELFLVIVYR